MLDVYIDLIDFKEININYNTNNLPYYLMNINIDIENIKNSKNVSDICFPNSLIHFDNKLYLLKNTDNILLCPIRDNIISYTNWFITNLKLFDKQYDFVEIPLIFNDYIYSKILTKYNKKKISISKSKYFNNYIDCLYLEVNIDKVTKPIHNLNEFKYMFEDMFLNTCNDYLNKINEVSSYVYKGNFFGENTLSYELQLENIKKNIKDN